MQKTWAMLAAERQHGIRHFAGKAAHAGKSTIADLLMGLIVSDQGQVLVDGVPLGPTTRQSWRNQVGYVPQETFLFHDTIRANLLLARRDATEAEIERALTWAAADAFVSRLPHGIDTVVGERGMRVSGGERQRLALARALLRQPAFLILRVRSGSNSTFGR